MTYFGLRFALGFENGIYKEITLINITNILSILSILFFVSIFILIVITKVKTKEHLFSYLPHYLIH